MSEYTTGAKAGALAGAISTIISIIWSYYVSSMLIEEVFKHIANVSSEALGMVKVFMAIGFIIGYIIDVGICVVVGILCTKVIVSLKYSWPIQGVIAAIIFFVINQVIGLAGSAFGSSIQNIPPELVEKIGYLTPVSYIVSLISALVFGLIYAYFMAKWLKQ
ncbi:MAG: hypothetical protein DRN04_08650 [Thermoprotei archaeon]|nr:MAG: hypothetical protein DRN04_08650 [Thermoprotei archaeon]